MGSPSSMVSTSTNFTFMNLIAIGIEFILVEFLISKFVLVEFSLCTTQLKVSKFQKQIILSSHSPKNQRNFSHFSALASKKSWKIVQTQDESTKILIWCYLTQWNSFIALIRPLLKARAKNVKNFVGFLGNEKTRIFAFEIYWPLVGSILFKTVKTSL